MADSSVDEASDQSVFPANTNVLYVGLQVHIKWLQPVVWFCRFTCGSKRLGSCISCAACWSGLHCSSPLAWTGSRLTARRPPVPRPLQAVERAVRGSIAAGSTDAVLPGMILNTAKVGAGMHQ